MKYILLILSLPTENATVRQRAWRALKVSGAAVVRDGVYLLPECEGCREILEEIAAEVVAGGGITHILPTETDDTDFVQLFDRHAEYSALLSEVMQAQAALSIDTVQVTLKYTRKLRKNFDKLTAIDFFPNEQQRQTDRALSELELACYRTLSPDEPQAQQGTIKSLNLSDYQGRTWASRQRPWVDRLASAWLISRFIDTNARILWLSDINDCPSDALGFDFDGAAFTHLGNRVTFEVLAESFGLRQEAMTRLGMLVHFLDVGGIQPAEAAGIESVLAGLRNAIPDDNQLMLTANAVFDGLFSTFQQQTHTTPLTQQTEL